MVITVIMVIKGFMVIIVIRDRQETRTNGTDRTDRSDI